MDAEDIARLVEELRVSDGIEKDAVTITKEEADRGKDRLERVVVGKIFSRRSINRETVRANLPKILRSRGNTEVEVVGHNLFVISFSMEADKRIALEEGPWHFFQDLMILKQTEAMQTPMEVTFDDITLWIQCHNVPIECMEPSIIRRIGEQVGTVEEIDVGESGLCVGKFARARVTRRVEAPLVRGIPLRQEGMEKEVIVLIQYEKLPEFCFICGKVGHIMRDCSERLSEGENPRFDGRLRAGRSFVGNRGGFKGASPQPSNSTEGGTEMNKLLGSVERKEEEKGREMVILNGDGDGIGKDKSEAGSEEDRASSEGEGDEELDDRMEVMVEVEGEHSDGTSSRGGGHKGEERRGGGLLSGDKSRSPGKKLKNSRNGGKGWKRLAREKRGFVGAKGSPLEQGGNQGGATKRKEKSSEEGIRGEEDLKHKHKQIKLRDEDVVFETAAAAEQPRRTL